MSLLCVRINRGKPDGKDQTCLARKCAVLTLKSSHTWAKVLTASFIDFDNLVKDRSLIAGWCTGV